MTNQSEKIRATWTSTMLRKGKETWELRSRHPNIQTTFRSNFVQFDVFHFVFITERFWLPNKYENKIIEIELLLCHISI